MPDEEEAAVKRLWLPAAALAVVLCVGSAPAPAWGQTAEELWKQAWAARSQDEKIRLYTEYLKQRPKNHVAYYNRGLAYELKHLFDQAIADFNQAIRLKPDMAMAYLERGHAYGGKRLFDLQQADYERNLQLSPESAWANAFLAWFLATHTEAKFRDGKRAVELAVKAVRLDSASSHMETLAAAYAEAGQWEEAVKTQEYAISMRREKKADEKEMAGAEKRLALYKEKKPYRQED